MPGARRQDQEGGDNSLQQQAGAGIINVVTVGVSAADVVEIAQRETRRIIDQELEPAAVRIAEERLGRFEEKVVDRFAENPQLRPAFADPDFQFSLRDASRAAASNDDDHTEQLLVDLLASRAEQGNSARLRLITSHAIRAADKLTIDALNGLTAQWGFSTLGPTLPGAMRLLSTVSLVSGVIRGLGLPSDAGWIEELEALGLANAPGGGVTRKPFRQFMHDRALPWLNPGINSDESQGLVEAAIAQCPWLGALMQPHPLKPGFVALAGTSVEEFRAHVPEGPPTCPELEQLISKNGFGISDTTASAEFTRRIDADASLVAAADWWDPLPAVNLTLIGRAIGMVNVRRHLHFTGVQTIAQMMVRSPGDSQT